MNTPLDKSEFEALADFRYQLRRFLRFSELLTRRHGITNLQYLLLLQVKGYPGREWACIGDYPPDNPASAWVGTRFVFELSSGDSGAAMVERACTPAPIAELTTVDFRQTGYDLRGRFAGFNNSAWGQVLQSLKAACEAKAA